jgi:hypothetical protein
MLQKASNVTFYEDADFSEKKTFSAVTKLVSILPDFQSGHNSRIFAKKVFIYSVSPHHGKTPILS